MKYKEQKIASFQDELHRWQLIKMTEKTNQITVNAIINTTGGYVKIYNNGNRVHIKDNEVELEAKKYGLNKYDDSYYNIKKEHKKIEPECHYQIRKDRKVICNVKWEGDAKHKFANMISMSLNQLNLFS